MRKGNVTILASVLAIALVAAGVGMGTMAWFSDTKVAGPTITTGNVNLKLSKTHGGSYEDTQEFAFPEGFAPGDYHQIDVYLKNIGTTGMRALWVYGTLHLNEASIANQIYITKVGFTDLGGMCYPGGGDFYDDGVDPDLSRIIFGDGNYPLTVYEFCTSRVPDVTWGYMRFFWGTSTDMIDYLPTDEIRKVELTFYFNELAGNYYQDRDCDFDIVFHATDDMGYAVIWENPGPP